MRLYSMYVCISAITHIYTFVNTPCMCTLVQLHTYTHALIPHICVNHLYTNAITHIYTCIKLILHMCTLIVQQCNHTHTCVNTTLCVRL